MAYPQSQGGLLNPMLVDLMKQGQQPLIHPTGIQPLGAAPGQRPAQQTAAPGAMPQADIPADADAAAPASQAPMSLGSGGGGAGLLNGMNPDDFAAMFG